MDGFVLEGPRAGDWRVASALVATAGFAMALAAMYGSALALLWPLPLILLAAESARRWYSSPRVRLAVADDGVSYSLGSGTAPIPWMSIRSVVKRPLAGRDCVLLVMNDGDELPLDPAPLGLPADDLLVLLENCHRAAVSH